MFEKAVLAIARKHFMYRQEDPSKPESSDEAESARRYFILPTGSFGQVSSQEELDFLKQTLGVKEVADKQKSLEGLFGIVSQGTKELNYFVDPERSIRAVDLFEDIILYLADATFSPLTEEAELAEPKFVYLPTHVASIQVPYESGLSFLERHLGAVPVPRSRAHFTKATRKEFPFR